VLAAQNLLQSLKGIGQKNIQKKQVTGCVALLLQIKARKA
jgi:hypothetical protein